ncbi:MAG: dihydroorotase [Candidatus Binatia bacterium]|nr:dihydroorotase [Candidatus Binatia bacterium]
MSDTGSRPIRIVGGTVVDPRKLKETQADVLVENGTVTAIGDGVPDAGDGIETIDATGLLVLPGAVDMHVHLREPGFEYKETIESGAKAAVSAGVTSVACMANTRPVNDTPAVTRFILERARVAEGARVYPIGAVSIGLEGKILAEFAGMHDAGIVAVSDDGRPVADAELMRRALECAKLFDIPVIDHAEDPALAAGGVMHEGAVSLRLGLRGIPAEAEEVMVARDIALAQLTGGRLHIAHVSAAGSVRRVRAARAAGVQVTAEVTPHHLWLTDEAVGHYDTNAKMAPPLRTELDRDALREGLRDGTIDAIATDHAPHHRDEKDVEFDCAQHGVVGLESLLPLTMRLVREGVLDLPTAVAKITSEPAGILRLPGGRLEVGAVADVAVVDPELEWTFDPMSLKSKSRNTPFGTWPMRGRALVSLVGGRVAHDGRQAVSSVGQRRSA